MVIVKRVARAALALLAVLSVSVVMVLRTPSSASAATIDTTYSKVVEVQNAVTVLRDLVTTVDAEVGGIDTKVTAVKTGLDGLVTAQNSHRNQANYVHQNAAAAKTNTEEIKTTVGTIGSDLSTLANAQASHRGQADVIFKTVLSTATGVSDVGSSLGTLSTAQASHRLQGDAIHSNVAGIVSSVGTLGTDLGKLATAQDSHRVQGDVMHGRLYTVLTTVEGVKAGQDSAYAAITTVDTRTKTIAGDAATVKTSVAANKAILDQLKTEVVGPASRLALIGAGMDKATAALVQTDAELALLQAAADKSAADAEALKVQVSGNGTLLETVRDQGTVTNASVDGLVQQVAVLKSQVQGVLDSQTSDTARVLDAIATLKAGEVSNATLDKVLASVEALRAKSMGTQCDPPTNIGSNPWALLAASTVTEREKCATTKRDAVEQTDRVIRALKDMQDTDIATRDKHAADAKTLADEIRLLREQAKADADRALVEAERLREQVKTGGDEKLPATTKGTYEKAGMPRLQGWVNAAKCLQTTFAGLDSSECKSGGPTLNITQGVSLQPFDVCKYAPGGWVNVGKTVGGACLVLAGFVAGLRALLSSLSMGEAVK